MQEQKKTKEKMKSCNLLKSVGKDFCHGVRCVLTKNGILKRYRNKMIPFIQCIQYSLCQLIDFARIFQLTGCKIFYISVAELFQKSSRKTSFMNPRKKRPARCDQSHEL